MNTTVSLKSSILELTVVVNAITAERDALQAVLDALVAAQPAALPAERKLHEASRDAAVDTLLELGYDYRCGPRWVHRAQPAAHGITGAKP